MCGSKDPPLQDRGADFSPAHIVDILHLHSTFLTHYPYAPLHRAASSGSVAMESTATMTGRFAWRAVMRL